MNLICSTLEEKNTTICKLLYINFIFQILINKKMKINEMLNSWENNNIKLLFYKVPLKYNS